MTDIQKELEDYLRWQIFAKERGLKDTSPTVYLIERAQNEALSQLIEIQTLAKQWEAGEINEVTLAHAVWNMLCADEGDEGDT